MDGIVAYRDGQGLSAARFLRDVFALAERLPARTGMLNLCEDPYRFMTGFAAALVRRQIGLLPPNRSPQTLLRTHADYPNSYVLVEGPVAELGIEAIEWTSSDDRDPLMPQLPGIPADQLAVVAFTSGSTGSPQPHAKTWGSLVGSARVESARLGLPGSGAAVIGTVPPQHMYGLESVVLLGLQGGNAVFGGRPFYPSDIADALRSVPGPRALVTTPVHLRALLSDDVELPEMELILSATAALSVDLAREAETRFRTRVLEIYGCTEAGQIAARRTTQGELWRTLDGLFLRQEGESVVVGGGHLPQPVALTDVLELHSETEFVLRGRSNDTLNIAGKRASLAELNRRLTEIEGVVDGAFFMPEHVGEGVTRLVAFVVAPAVPKVRILAALRRSVDPAFLPRPLHRVDALPRSATGKLPIDALRRLHLGLSNRSG